MNNFCIPELLTLKVLTQKETMVTQISAESPSPNLQSGKSYVKKISVCFWAICANFPWKIEKYELKVIGVGKIWKVFSFK